jgi:hypothetical protein
MATEPNLPKGHEQRDASAAWIAGIIVLLFVLGVSIQAILGGFLSSLKHSPPPTDSWRPVPRTRRATPAPPPGPRLQVSAPADLEAFRAREEMELHSYGWINRTSGVVRIPIEKAMDLVLQQGLPVRTNAGTNKPGPSSYQLIQQRPDRKGKQ